MDRSSLLFCAVSLVATVLVAVLFFPMASLTRDELAASRQATPAEEMGSIELGDFGSVTVLELVDYYMQNPPVAASGDAPARKVRFQGC